MPPRVAIVTPSYNQGPYLRATIESVLNQDYPDIEYLVMDGGSTDSTLDVLRSYGRRVRWVSEPDRGQTDAIVKGFSSASGEILTWLNSDDTLEPSAVSEAVAAFAEHDAAPVVYGDASFIDAAGQFIARCAHIEPFDRDRLLHYSDFIVQPAAFFRRAAYDAVGGLDPDLHYAMDYDLWLKLAQLGDFAYLPRHWANYRWFGENKTAIGGYARLAEVERVAESHGQHGLPAYFRLEAVLLHASAALRHYRAGRPDYAGESLSCAFSAIANSPRAWKSLMCPATWKIIATGQRLRAHAASHQA